ncbi:MAG TPA: GNAT family N-acetyltransferase [Acidobacteriaceae bacterium]|jgi:GNAT superfamily N-acetyltransferase|nr:GNAT family N-acetyltransferase [Acidobacteriaceae bacterium]
MIRTESIELILRPAAPQDAIDVARVHVRSWQTAYRGLLPDVYLDQLRPEDRAGRYDFATADPSKPFTVVAVEEGRIRGFATTAPARDADGPECGELFALYVDPERWRRGYGLALVAAARRRLAERGHCAAVLWMLEGNARADRFYRADGWAPDGTRRTDTVWGIQVNEVRYRRAL